MRLLQERLASNFTTVAVDWPGFGDEPRPAIHWRPDAYLAFVRYLLTEAVPRPNATVAAGHAASYALAVGAAAPNSTGPPVSDRANVARPLANNDGRKT